MELYEEVENKKKSKLPMIIGICLTILIVIIIAIIGTIIYLEGVILKVSIDGQSNSNIEKLLYFPEDDAGKVYIPIRAIAKYLNYEDYRGDYNVKSEDSSKCYVKNDNEIAMFTKDSDRLVETRGDADYEYLTLDEKVFEKDGELYTTPTGIEKAFNVLFQYDSGKKKITIYTMNYLNQYYASKLKIDGQTTELSKEYADGKAIFEDMMIVIKNKQYGVLNVETGEAVLENKYEEIKYLPATSDFLVKSNGKYGVIGKDATVKVRGTYDEIKIMDNQNGLYLVKQNNLYGVVNTKGEVIMQPEYRQIGVDMSKYSNSGIENQYVLLNEVIPVENSENMWGIFSVSGEKIRDFEFSGIGCSVSSSSQSSGSYPAIVIPGYKIIIVEKDKHYNLMTTSGEELVPTYVLENIYMKTNSGTGENTYYMAYNNNEKVMSVEEWLESTGR